MSCRARRYRYSYYRSDHVQFIHAGGEEFLYRAGLATVASRLDPFRFVRIHRSSIVNLKSVAFLERRSHGEFDVVLKSGAQLMMSRSYRAEVEAMLGQSL